MALTDIKTYPVAHNKNGGSGGNTYVMGGQKSSIYNSLNVHSINASQGNIDYLKVKSMSANDASILYLQTREGSIQRLNGDLLQYNTGYIGTLATDTISTKKLKAEDIEAINAFIETIQSKEITTEYLTVTKQAHFFELIIDKIRSVGGQLILTPASCVVDYVWGVTSGGDRIPATPENLNQIVAFDVFWRAEEDTGRSVTNDFIQNDQVICQSFNNAHVGTSYNVSNKYYWRLVDSILSDAYVNLTTGALTQSQQYASTNDYEVAMKITQTKYSGDTYYNNAIKWDAVAQTIQGLQTNVSWTDGTLGQNEAVHGTFSSASQIYGIQITPHEQSDDFPITSRLEFNIKQKVDSSYIIPNKINIGVYFNNDTFMMFNNVLLDGNGDVVLDLDDPDAPIEAIVIVSTADVNWHLCHCMRISNTVCDDMLSGYSSIPSAGDNLVQLGYRGTDDNDRQSAIIISAYKSPDPNVHAPSYAQYMGINDFNLGSHRGSYIDARGAKFVGDITLCSVNGKTIGETLAEQEEEIEKKNKKLLVNAASIQVYTAPNSSSEEVYSLDPSHINVSILAPGDTGMDTLTAVPEGYIVDFSFFNNNNIDVSSNNFMKTANQSLSNIELPKGTYVGDISRLRIRLIKDEAGVPAANAIVVDYVDLSYIRAALPSVDGGRYEFRYKNAKTAPTKPTANTSGLTDGWSTSATTPDFANGYYTWMTQCYCTAANEYGTWSDPVRITGDNGLDGEDGTDLEFIYTTNDTGVAPAAPPQTQVDDWYGYDANTGYTWTDNPVGVAANRKYEYVSQRVKRPGQIWGPYSTPVIWSKWGEKGMDGDGYEYIFKLTAENTNPGAPIDSPQTDDYVPTGWTDDPKSVTQSLPYQWCSVRKKTNGTWGAFSTPALWARYAEQGETGGHYEFRYKNNATQPDAPTGTGLTDGWAIAPTNPDVNAGIYTWMSQSYVTPGQNGASDTYGTWTTPIRITGGQGEDGADGTDIEFVYTRNNTGVAPAAPATNQTDDWHGTSGGITWTDNPQGVQADMMYEYVSMRYKRQDVWTAYTTPVIWSKWGEKGMDGDGYEYIYKLTATANVPDNPTPANTSTTEYQTADYVPAGWSDDPGSVTESTPYQWVCVRERRNGTWGAFSTPALWSRWATQGSSGGHYEFRYKNSLTQPNAPTGTGESNGWSRIPTNPTESEKYTWMSQTYVNGNDEYGTWTTPIRITGPQGEHGADGNDIEFIYTRNNTGTAPSTPATSQTDDYVPSGWTDNPQGVASDMMYEYISTRTKENGTWSAFSTPVIWSKWGEKGMDGDGYEYIYKATANSTAPDNPTPSSTSGSTYQADDYVPSGWSDEPVTLTSTNAFLWVCVRKKTRGVWGRFSNPSLWSHYASAEGGTPGADGNDAEFNYLVPNKEILMAMIINSISDNANCDLKCELDYSLVHVKGSNVSTLSWATSSYVLRIIAYNASGGKIGSTIYATNNGYASGTPQGTYSQSNLLSVLNSAAAQRDYMKCYTQYNSKCPVYLEVSLMSGNTELDKRIVPVVLENGAVLKVTDDAINSAVAKANTNMNTTLNNYSTTQQTAELITNTVNAQMSNYSTTAQMNSAIQQSAQSITSTVSSNYYNKNEVDALLNDENSTKEIIDLKNKDENTYYPISVNMAPGGINGTPIANGLILTMQVDRTLNEGGSYGTDDWYGSPSWGSTAPGQSHGRGVALLCNWSIIPSGWGEWNNGEMFVNNYMLRWTAKGSNTNDGNNTSGVKVIGNLEQHNPSSTMIFYLRGGSKYNFRCNWAGLHHEVHTSSWSTGTSEPKTYNAIYGGDSSSIIVPTKDKMNKSEIEQTARKISLSVYSEQDGGDGITTEQLKRTGIDITSGKIDLVADNTNIIGNLNLKRTDNGITLYDTSGNARVNILPKNVPTPTNGDDKFSSSNFINLSSTKKTKVASENVNATTTKTELGSFAVGNSIKMKITPGIYGLVDVVNYYMENHTPTITCTAKLYIGSSTSAAHSTSKTLYRQNSSRGTYEYPSFDWTVSNLGAAGTYKIELTITGTEPNDGYKEYTINGSVDYEKQVQSLTYLGLDGLLVGASNQHFAKISKDAFEFRWIGVNGDLYGGTAIKMSNDGFQRVYNFSIDDGPISWVAFDGYSKATVLETSNFSLTSFKYGNNNVTAYNYIVKGKDVNIFIPQYFGKNNKNYNEVYIRLGDGCGSSSSNGTLNGRRVFIRNFSDKRVYVTSGDLDKGYFIMSRDKKDYFFDRYDTRNYSLTFMTCPPYTNGSNTCNWMCIQEN